MMDTLVRYGFSIEEIKNMMDSNQEIEKTDDKIILELITILEKNNCNKDSIKNTFITNPFYLSKKPLEIEKLILEFKKIGIKDINLLIDSNPYIINLKSNEIKSIKDSLNLTKQELINYFYYESSKII